MGRMVGQRACERRADSHVEWILLDMHYSVGHAWFNLALQYQNGINRIRCGSEKKKTQCNRNGLRHMRPTLEHSGGVDRNTVMCQPRIGVVETLS